MNKINIAKYAHFKKIVEFKKNFQKCDIMIFISCVFETTYIYR